MRRNIIAWILLLTIAIGGAITTLAITVTSDNDPSAPTTTISEDYIPSETTLPTEVEEETSVIDVTEAPSVSEPEETEAQVQEIVTEPPIKPTEPTIAPTERPVKPTEPVVIPTEPPVIETTEPEVTETPSELEVTESEDIWAIRAAEYPEATTAWLYMKSLGWNDYVCAGIMGNFMSECGGQTLAINPYAYNSREHGGGICGWLYRYFPAVQGQNLEFQLQYLADTLEDQMGSNTTSNFLSMTNYYDTALTFAKKYERCSSGSYGLRQRNAEKAYAYFVG